MYQKATYGYQEPNSKVPVPGPPSEIRVRVTTSAVQDFWSVQCEYVDIWLANNFSKVAPFDSRSSQKSIDSTQLGLRRPRRRY